MSTGTYLKLTGSWRRDEMTPDGYRIGPMELGSRKSEITNQKEPLPGIIPGEEALWEHD